LQHAAVVIQLQVQAQRRCAEMIGQFVGRRWRTLEQASEQIVAGGQNFRLDEAVRLAGRLGTAPTPGSTRNGMI